MRLHEIRINENQFLKQKIVENDRILARAQAKKYIKDTESAFVGMLSEVICKDIFREHNLQILDYPKGSPDDWKGLDLILVSGNLVNHSVDVKGANLIGEHYNKIFVVDDENIAKKKENELYALSFIINEYLYFVGFIRSDLGIKLPHNEFGHYFPLEQNSFENYKKHIITLESIL